MVRLDNGPISEDHRALKHIAQFTHVPGPAFALQACFHRIVKLRGCDSFRRRGKVCYEPLSQGNDVFAPLPKRWQANGKYCQTVLEVLAESPFFHHRLQVTIRSGHPPDVHGDGG